MRELFTRPIQSTRDNFRQIFLSTPLFLQFLFALRQLWWGIGTAHFHFYFSIRQLDYLSSPWAGYIMIFFGLVGLFGVVRGKYYPTITFSIFNVFLFGIIALSFVENDVHSVSGVNYFIEMLGAIWLVFRVQYDRAKFIALREVLGK